MTPAPGVCRGSSLSERAGQDLKRTAQGGRAGRAPAWRQGGNKWICPPKRTELGRAATSPEQPARKAFCVVLRGSALQRARPGGSATDRRASGRLVRAHRSTVTTTPCIKRPFAEKMCRRHPLPRHPAATPLPPRRASSPSSVGRRGLEKGRRGQHHDWVNSSSGPANNKHDAKREKKSGGQNLSPLSRPHGHTNIHGPRTHRVAGEKGGGRGLLAAVDKPGVQLPREDNFQRN